MGNLNCQFGLTVKSRITWRAGLLECLCGIILIMLTDVGVPTSLWTHYMGSCPNIKGKKRSETQVFISNCFLNECGCNVIGCFNLLRPGLLCHDGLYPLAVSQYKPLLSLKVPLFRYFILATGKVNKTDPNLMVLEKNETCQRLYLSPSRVRAHKTTCQMFKLQLVVLASEYPSWHLTSRSWSTSVLKEQSTSNMSERKLPKIQKCTAILKFQSYYFVSNIALL